MFSGKTFVFIGHFKKIDKKTKKDFKNLVTKHGGKNVTSISNKTDYVIFPTKITNEERNNKQIKNIKNIYSTKISFIYCQWLMDCIVEKKILPVKTYKVEEFHKLIFTYNDLFNKTPDLFFSKIVPNNCKIWKEFLHNNGNVYYYNILTGETITNNNTYKNFKEMLIGEVSIIESDYPTESTGKKIKDNLEYNISNFKKCIDILNNYENNINRKRKRDSIDWVKKDFLKKKKKKLNGN